MDKKNLIEIKAKNFTDIYLKDYMQSDEELYKTGIKLLKKEIEKCRSNTDKISFLKWIIDGLNYYKALHQKDCQESKNNSFCQWDENYDNCIFFANQAMKKLILNQQMMTYDEKIKAIVQELASYPKRRGILVEILKTCDILYNDNDWQDFMNHLHSTNLVTSNGGGSVNEIEIELTLNGLEYLRQTHKIDNNNETYSERTNKISILKVKEKIETNAIEIEHPIVFISYSWDDEDHKEWVLSLANRLRGNGVDVILDRYNLKPGENVTYFMENSLRTSNRIITILTPKYKNKADDRIGGVGQEYTIINNELIRNISKNDRVIPILRKGDSEISIPEFLKPYLYVNFTNDNNFENAYEELLRDIFKSPKIELPKLGAKPSFTKGDIQKPLEVSVFKKPELDINQQIQEINLFAISLTSDNYESRKDKASKIYDIAPKVPLYDIINLSNDKNLDTNIALAICLKSISENLSIDLGRNPDIRQFIVSNLSNKSSFLRYRIFDFISVSPILQKDFNFEIKNQSGKEKNEEVISKINSILEIKPETKTPKIKTKFQSLIAKNDIEGTLKSLGEYTQKNDKKAHDSIILLSGEFANLKQETLRGTISYQEVNIQRNRLRNNLLNLINELDTEPDYAL